MASPIRTEPCPQCQAEGFDSSGDNLQVFESGVRYCIARHGTLGVNNEMKTAEENTTVEVNLVSDDKNPSKFPLEGEYRDIKSRAISKKTCKFYGYMVDVNKKCHLANYYSPSGNLVMQQMRTADKKFPIFGDRDYNKTLWGSHLFTPDDRVFITITEGQIDTLSIAEAFNCKYPVVSLPNGAKSAAEIISKNKKYLSGFKYVVLAFDNDKDGNQATTDCLKLLEPGKMRVAHWPQKDANDMLKSGDAAGLRQVIYGAVEYIPEPILTGHQLLKCLDGYKQKTKEWPHKKMNKIIGPIHIPAIYTFAAWPGVGKTAVMADIIKSVVSEGKKIGIISLEEPIQKLLLKITDMVFGTNLRQIHNRELTPDEKDSVSKIINNVVTYNHHEYGSEINTIIDNLPYIAQSLKCEFIIFDNLSYSATNSADNERRDIDKAMLKLKDSSTKYNYTLFNICHLNDCDFGFKEATIRGSRSPSMYSDQVIYLGRDVESEDIDLRNTLTFYIKKDRETGLHTGKSFTLKYDPIKRGFIDE